LRDELEQTTIANKEILLEVEKLKQDVSNSKVKAANAEGEKNRLTKEIQYAKTYLDSINLDLREGSLIVAENEKNTIIKDLNRVFKELELRGEIISNQTEEIAEKTMRIEALEGTILPSKEKTIENLYSQLKESKDRLLLLQKTILIEQGKETMQTNSEVQSLQRQIQHLEQDILQLNSELKNKENMISLFEEKVIPQKEKIISDMKELLAKKQDLVNSKEEALQNKQEEFDKELERINEKLIAVNQHLGQVQQQNKQAIKEKKELESALKESQQESQTLRESLDQAQTEIQRMTQEKAEPREIVQEISLEGQEEQARFAKRSSPQKRQNNEMNLAVEEVKNEMNNKILMLQQELEERNQQLANVRKEFEYIQDQLESKGREIIRYEEKLGEAVGKNQQLQRQFETLQNQREGAEMSLLKEAKQEIAQKENDIQKSNHKIRDLENLTQNLKLRLADEESSSIIKQKQIGDFKEFIETLERKNNDLKKKLQLLELELANAKDLYLSETSALRAKFDEANNELQSEIKTLQDTKNKIVEAKNQEISSQIVNIERLKKTNEALKEDLAFEKSKREEAEMRLARELDKAEKGIEHAITKEEELKNRISSLEQENSRLHNRLEELRSEYESNQGYLEKSHQELKSQHEEQRIEFEIALQGKVETITTLQAKLRELQDLGNEKDLGVAKLKSRHLEEIQEKDERIHLLESDLKNLARDFDQKKLEMAELEKKFGENSNLANLNFENKIKELTNEIELQKEKLHQATISHEQEIERKQEELNNLKQRNVTEINQEIQNAKDQIETLQSELKKQTEENKTLTDRLTASENSFLALKTQFEQQNAQLTQLDQRHTALQKDYDELTIQRDNYVHKLEKVGNKKEDLDIKYQALKEEKKSLNEVINQLRQSVASLQHTQSSSEQKLTEEMQQKDQIISTFAQSFQDLEKNGYLTGVTHFAFEDKTQVEEVMSLLRTTFINQKEMNQKTQDELQKTLQTMNESLAKQREEFEQEANVSKEEVDTRIKKLYNQIEEIFNQNCVEKPPVGENLPDGGIHLYLSAIRDNLEAYKALKSEHSKLVYQVEALTKEISQYQQSKRSLEEENAKLAQESSLKFENLKSGLENELEKAKKDLGDMKQIYEQREAEINELKTLMASKKYHEKPSN